VGEILVFVCGFLRQFEVLSLEGEEFRMPVPASAGRYGGGVEFPASPWRVRIRNRRH
jgi:hypothetical protein